jgi:hypothetical protein
MPKRSSKPDADEIAFRVAQESTRDHDAAVAPQETEEPAAVALG